MAVAFEGFSIREYASKMRSENVAQSWPFAGDIDEKQIGSLLPPITVTKFRWWLHELDAARPCHVSSFDAAIQADVDVPAAEVLEAPPLGCSLSGGLKTPSIASTLLAHAGNCLSSEKMKHRAKSKSKAPKRRSIVEIIAVAPQIDVAGKKLNSSRIPRASSTRNSNLTGTKNKRNNKEKKNLLEKSHLLPVDNTKFKKKKRTRKKKNHQPTYIAFEENSCKLKGKTASNGTRNPNGSCFEIYTSSIFYGRVCRKKPRLKSSSPHNNNLEAIMPSEFHKRQDSLDVPIRGILKKQGKFMVSDSSSGKALRLEKHVKFLDNVEVQGSQQNSSIQQPDGSVRRAGVDKLTGSDEDFSLVELTSGDDEGPRGGNHALVTVEKEHLTDTQEPGNAENHSNPEHASPYNCRKGLLTTEASSTCQILNCYEDLHTSTKGKKMVIDDSTTLENSRSLTPTTGNQVTYTHFQMPEDPLGDNIVGASHLVCGKSMTRSPMTFSLPSSSRLFQNENPEGSFSLQSSSALEDTNALPLIYQQLCPQRPKSLIDGAFTFPDHWNSRPCSSTEEHIYKDLQGLPLYSCGELFQKNSASSNSCVLDKSDGLCMVSASSGYFPGQILILPSYAKNDLRLKENHIVQRSCPRDLDLFPMHNCESRGLWTDVLWQNPERHVAHSHLLNMDPNLMNVSLDMYRKHGDESLQLQTGLNKTTPPKEKEDKVSPNATPLTMRLMGKDVAVALSDT